MSFAGELEGGAAGGLAVQRAARREDGDPDPVADGHLPHRHQRHEAAPGRAAEAGALDAERLPDSVVAADMAREPPRVVLEPLGAAEQGVAAEPDCRAEAQLRAVVVRLPNGSGWAI